MQQPAQLLPQIDEITGLFRSHLSSLTSQQLNWKPRVDRWSIAQNLDHLIVINRTYFPVIAAVRENRYSLPWFARFGFVVNFLGRFILASVKPDRKQKIKTFQIWEPSASHIGGDILDRFISHQQELKNIIHDSEDLLQKGTVISSPANPVIVYKLETAFDIIVTHERRHFEQAKEVLRSAGFPR